MKSKYQLYTILLVLLSGLAACKKSLLDRAPLDSVSTQIFWASETDVQSALAGVYSRLQQNFLGYERVYLDGLSDNAYLDANTNQPNMLLMTTGGISPTLGGALANMYSSPYRAISSCNFFLDNVDKAPVTESKKNIYKAEVRFIRALCYFDLVQSYGGVPLYKNYPKTLDEVKVAKSTKEQVYAFIEEDLDFAISNLPDEKYNGHAVKGSAQGIKARVLLTQQKWSDAATLLQTIMSGAAGKFALSNNYASLFRTAGQGTAAVNIEIMFSVQYLAVSNPQRTSPGAAGMDIELGWYSLMQPYRNLVDDYEMTDGKSITESPLYNAATPYANRDPRLDLTIKLPGEVWKNPTTNATWSGSYAPATTFITEKYVDLTRAPFTTTTATSTDQDYIHLRYADILLMYAEAKNEATGPDATVYAAMDLVRGRTGIAMPATDQAKYNTKEKLRDYIRHERRIEFALEGQRYNDLKRWNIAHVKLPTLVTPANVPLKFELKNYLLPFQQSERDNNPKLEQNDGYL
ncbi:RagB/SusD family nutrient uptake outer membrane protein [Lacibacter luteus]|uniref:RagB/SusD family nutrient uptake outer membrane protein n=1 Tax=Lacibacter luteus TaxID=2508719 RepID=A0A4Q1CEC9_9BACT|nr:RagB/SusD family nutrient uptake outer membrane protein [Lacibacter luteus]RXK58014.1 RagB/SusD family nutrient uptake outer membrane protein [Lacibacter luteus]